MPRPDDRLQSFFGPGGTLSRAHPDWEPRPAQEALARDVQRTLRDGGHLVAEAGTGTGKTLAYLVPALLSDRPVVVSTGTKALQDQLATQDLPFLTDRCRLPFRWTVLKGRDNYLCRHRLGAFRLQPRFDDRGEAQAWPEVVRWAEETATGDVSELTALREHPSFWPEISARDSTCLGARCPVHDSCHLHELRRQAQDSDVVVVNHHLFLADAAIRQSRFGSILPDVDTVVFDEAHRLEGAATSFFGRSVSTWKLRELADDVPAEIARAGLELAGLGRAADRLAAAAAGLAGPWPAEEGRRVLPATLAPAQEDALRAVRVGLVELLRALGAATEPRPPAVEPFVRRATDLAEDLELIESREDAGWVYWSDRRRRGVMLTATPVDVSSLLREWVFSRLRSSVLCSATLAVGGRMRHARARLGLAEPPPSASTAGDAAERAQLEVREAVHASPFDHASQGLLYLPRDLPPPRDRGFASACGQRMCELVEASGGRAFLLFTSYVNLHRVRDIVADTVDYPLLVQGEAPKGELLRRFRAEPGSVLLATASFWEGVDVAGSALSLVVIDKLPFAVPTDPIFAARSRNVEEAGGDSFRDLSLPTAVLSLKQGVGRLIRSRSDRGVAAVLDPRILGTRWGRAFAANLPPFRRTSRLEDVQRFFADSVGGRGA